VTAIRLVGFRVEGDARFMEADMDDTDDHRIGSLIEDPARKSDWRAFVAALHEAWSPGGPLEGWLFHGTSEDRARSIAEDGVTTTESLFREDGATGHDDWHWTDGTHWGIPKVAAFYAEDRIESTEDPDLELAIVAARVADLEECGTFSADGQTIDCPLHTRLGRPEAETETLWDASAQDWKACLSVLGTLLVLGPVGPDEVRILRCAADVEELARAAGPGAPGR
jgi:hypothetical protein